MSREPHRSRRRFLRATGAVAVVGLAGCTQNGGDGTTPTTGDGESGGDGGTDGGSVRIGTILPFTGNLDAYGGGMQAAVDIAVEDINGAGGVLGREVDVSHKDSETDATASSQRYQELVNEEGVVGFVGAAGSGQSVPLAENVADDGVMQVSPASTTPVLASLGYSEDDIKYFGRTAPNDGQQGIVMGRILNDDGYLGADTAAFLYINNPYGEGLAEAAEAEFDGETVASVGYNPDTTDYTSTLDQVFDDDPDAVGFVGYPDNGVSIIEQWSDGGYGGEWVLSEGLQSQEEFLDPLGGVVEGMYITVPESASAEGSETFEQKMRDAGTDPTAFSHHSYDATMLMALAAERAGEASGEAIARNIRAVSRPPGETVTVGDFEEAKGILEDDGEINYEGASSSVDLNENLEPLTDFSISRIEGGEVDGLESIPREEFEGRL